MKTPIELLEEELNVLKFLSTRRRGEKTIIAKKLLPDYEKAIKILKQP